MQAFRLHGTCRLLTFALFVFCVAARSEVAKGAELGFIAPSGSDFGGIGLLQTRTARFGDDGAFEVGYSEVFPYERYLITIQALPWVEGTFRYTSVSNRDFAGDNLTNTGSSFKDRGADVKFKLLGEGAYHPQLALGFQDGLGTGVFSGEYLVASKYIWDFDFSLGIGWGYNAGSSTIKNPLIHISDQFAQRGAGNRQGGTLLPSSFFSGANIGFFGGVEYYTPIKNISLKLEYDPNNYRTEPLNNEFEATSHWNYGVSFRLFPWFNLQLGYERGREVMLRMALTTNFHDPGLPKNNDPPPALVVRPTAGTTRGVVAKETGVARAPGRNLMHPVLRSRAISLGGIGGVVTSLRAEGINVISARREGRSTIIELQNDSDEEPEVVAALAAVYLDAPTSEVHITDQEGNAKTFSVDELQNRLPVLLLERELRRSGVVATDITFSQSRASVTLSGPPEVDPYPIAAAISRVDHNIETVSFSWGASALETVFVDLRVGAVARAADAPTSQTVAIRRLDDTEAEFDQRAAADRIFADLDEERIEVEAVKFSDSLVTAWVSLGPYREVARTMGRVSIILANHSPPEVEEIQIVLMGTSGELSRTTVRRHQLELAVQRQGSVDEIWHSARLGGPGRGVPSDAYQNIDLRPNFKFGLRPSLRQHIGSRDGFYIYQLYARLSGIAELARGFYLDGAAGVDLYSGFGRLNVEPDGTLPRVRSDIKEYLRQGENNIVRLQAVYTWSPAPDVYTRLSAGIFEEMYGGYSGEILYRPFGARAAVGFDLNYVRQRDFDQLFTFRDYSVATGHINIYYDIPFYDLLGQVHAGRYLAGDYGATFQVSRRFDSGMRAGAFLTLTDVPFTVFGEGSFDKGFFIVIPFDLFATRSSNASGSFGFRPLTKDGGQRVTSGPRLYDITNSGNVERIARDWDRFLE